ncbi:FCD domain-containing protein [Sphingorhabdus sp. YGSMI21]|uniref:FCD domain-containing protein n=1 Tax=Sphingorhabdus sp. YGSMI21 TaxID=2077182 RepID=UPI0013DC46C8|nr:FCD domain-containing protein [Sphingorhabdus sp. YGSMI21]
MTSAPQDITTEDAASFDVYRQLRLDIISCHLKPNQKLRFDALRKSYGVGVGTLREALSHLVSDGMVRIDAGRGFRVAPVSVEDLEDVTAWRVEFETRALAASIRNGDDDWEAEVVTSYHLLSKVTVPDPEAPPEEWSAYGDKHVRFHEALVASCGSPWLLFFRSALQSQALRYQALAMSNREKMIHRAMDEHKALMNATLSRDAEQATALIAKHIQDTSEDVRIILSQSAAVGNLNADVVEERGPRRRGRPRKSA